MRETPDSAMASMTRIVTTHYRYKHPPRKRQAAALEGPAVVKAAEPAKAHKRAKSPALVDSTPANDDHEPARIVTARKPGKRYVDVPEVTEEEHQRRGDLSDAMMQEFKRLIAEKIRS